MKKVICKIEYDNVNQPFISIEIHNNKLEQAYHRFNDHCTPAEEEWIAAWCKRHGILSS